MTLFKRFHIPMTRNTAAFVGVCLTFTFQHMWQALAVYFVIIAMIVLPERDKRDEEAA